MTGTRNNDTSSISRRVRTGGERPMELRKLLRRVITSHALGCRGQIEVQKEIGNGIVMLSADFLHKQCASILGSKIIQDTNI